MEKQTLEELKDFYTNWYKKSNDEIEYEINVCEDKVSAGMDVLNSANIGKVNSILEMGCGYGRNLFDTVNQTGALYGMGCDISKDAIDYCNKNYGNKSMNFIQLRSIDIREAVAQIRSVYGDTFDVTILYDVLEHIPKPKLFIKELASISKYFLIELPLFDTILSRYMLPGRMNTYASSRHPDGHFWDFNVSNVHHFVVSLGLTPINYDFKKYSLYTQYPPHLKPRTIKGYVFYNLMKYSNAISRNIIPNRIFLRLIGKGCFICLAEWLEDFILE